MILKIKNIQQTMLFTLILITASSCKLMIPGSGGSRNGIDSSGGENVSSSVVPDAAVNGPLIQDAEVLSKGADKETEALGGLPGYQLQCTIAVIPTDAEFDATQSCQLLAGNADDQINWYIKRPDQDQPIQQTLPGNEPFEFTIDGADRLSTLALVVDSQIEVKLGETQLIKQDTLKDIIAAGEKSYRVGARCDSLFGLMLTDDQSVFFYGSISRFEGCDTLASALNQQIVSSNVRPQVIPEAKTGVSVSCADEKLTFFVTTSNSSSSQMLSPIPQAACENFAVLVHSVEF